MSKCPVCVGSKFIGLIGLFLMSFGGLSIVINQEKTSIPSLFQFILSKELVLTKSSRSFKIWRAPPVPIYIDFYLFDWLNPDEINDPNSKPRFVEKGPYRFIEFKEHVDLLWNDNGTINYKQKKRWHFDEENSIGPLDDNITMLNAVALSAATTVRTWSLFQQVGLGAVMAATKQTIWLRKTVREILFDGFENSLLNIARKMPAVQIPYDKFGWFYTRNNSDKFDGYFQIDTGVHGIDKIGDVKLWENNTRTKFYEGWCGLIRGSSGSLFPPIKDKYKRTTMFSPELCRSIDFDYDGEEMIEGVKGYKYIGSKYMVDNGEMDPSNLCFCNGDCVPPGVMNVTSCRFGAPAFVSYPHFYQADPYYTNLIDGMKPNKNEHEFHIILEPTTGIPLDVSARLQINLLVRNIPSISMFKRIPHDIYFPMIWFNNKASLTPDMSEELQLLLSVPKISVYISIFIVIMGAILILLSIHSYYCGRRIEKQSSEKREKILLKKQKPEIQFVNRTKPIQY